MAPLDLFACLSLKKPRSSKGKWGSDRRWYRDNVVLSGTFLLTRHVDRFMMSSTAHVQCRPTGCSCRSIASQSIVGTTNSRACSLAIAVGLDSQLCTVSIPVSIPASSKNFQQNQHFLHVRWDRLHVLRKISHAQCKVMLSIEVSSTL